MPTFDLFFVCSLAAAATLVVVIGARVSNILYVLLSERGILAFLPSAKLAAAAEGENRHFVYYSSPARFWKHIKLVPWDAYGEFCIGEFELVFRGRRRNGESVDLTFPKFDSLMTYVPANFLRDGGLAWVAIGNNREMHYFTCGRALLKLPPSSSTSTTGLYEAVTDTFVREKVTAAAGE